MAKPNKPADKKQPYRLECCKCRVELTMREMNLGAHMCFVCLRIENDKLGLVTEDIIKYDG